MEYGARFNRAGFNQLALDLQGDGATQQTALTATARLAVDCTMQSAQQITLAVGLQPGQVLEIDSERMEIRIDGEPVVTGYSGIALFMQPETTTVFYEDKTGSRDLDATIIYTDRYY